MPLISLREFARRNGVSDMAISKAVRAGRLPHVNGKIDPEQAQPVWDRIKDPIRAGRKLPRGNTESSLQAIADGAACKLDRKLEVCTQVCGLTDDRSTATGVQVCTPPGEQPNANLAPEASQVCTPRHAMERQVYTIKGMPIYPEPPVNGRDRLAITIWFNGAEEVVLDARRAEKDLSLPAYLLSAAGYPPAQVRPAKPSRRSAVPGRRSARRSNGCQLYHGLRSSMRRRSVRRATGATVAGGSALRSQRSADAAGAAVGLPPAWRGLAAAPGCGRQRQQTTPAKDMVATADLRRRVSRFSLLRRRPSPDSNSLSPPRSVVKRRLHHVGRPR